MAKTSGAAPSSEGLRLDKFLKVSRLIKRRSVANDACDTDHVLLNGKPAKPGAKLKVGDIITLRFGLAGGWEYTQKEVADRLGISQSYISRLEKRIIDRLRREMLKKLQV
jgi:Ribosome-associated heat shock protein implicated in the recycling of the 50S subunit (S4 paralog)